MASHLPEENVTLTIAKRLSPEFKSKQLIMHLQTHMNH